MTDKIQINIASDFSRYPVGRDCSDSEDSNGKKFREEHLVPALDKVRNKPGVVVVSFEGVESFGSSFLEEAFGGLVRKCGWTAKLLRKKLHITYEWSGYARFERRMWKHIEEAKPEI